MRGSGGNSPDKLPTEDLHATQQLCKPDCEKCGGVGYLRYDVPWTHPLFGKLDLCPNVDRWDLPYARRFGITKDEYKRMDWGSLIDVGDTKAAARAIQRVLHKKHGWVYIWGSNGLAKTLMLKIAVARWLREEHEGAYARMAEILDHLRAAYNDDGGAPASEERLDWWATVPLLCIDEFDRLRQTEFADERRFLLMDKRYESALNRESVTILASEVAPSQLPGYLADRVYDGRFEVIGMTGDSLRPAMSWDRDG